MHLFKELNDRGFLPKEAQEQLSNNPAIPMFMGQGGQPPTGAPGNQMIPQTANWVGPKTSIFENAQVPTPSEDDGILNTAVQELVRKHPFFEKYPMEPRIVGNEGDTTVGEIMIGNSQGTPVSVPFVVRDGKMKPFVTVGIGGELYSIGDEVEFSQLMESPMPTQPMPGQAPQAPQTSAGAELATQGPTQAMSGSPGSTMDRSAMANVLTKQSDLVEYISNTPLGPKLADMLEPPKTVMQVERVPFGCIVKEASADYFNPIVREIPIEEVPPHILDEFTPGKSFFTETEFEADNDIGQGVIKIASDIEVEIETEEDGKKKIEKTKENVRAAGEVSVWDALDTSYRWRTDKKNKPKKKRPPVGMTLVDPDWNPVKVAVYPLGLKPEPDLMDGGKSMAGVEVGSSMCDWIAIADDGRWGWIKEHKNYAGWKSAVPKLTMGLDEIFTKNVGFSGYLVSKYKIPESGKFETRLYGPVEFYKPGKLTFRGESLKPVTSSKIQSLAKGEGKLYIPAGTKFIAATKEVTFQDIDVNADIGFKINIEKTSSSTVSLRGLPVERAKWGTEDVQGKNLSTSDAVFVLSALGADESDALGKVAEALEKNASLMHVDKVLETPEMPEYEVNLGFLKLAAAIPGEDRLLALQFMSNKTLDKFLEELEKVEELMDDLSAVTLAAQIGFAPVDETLAYQALKNVQELVYQLKKVKTERSMGEQRTSY